MTWLIVFFVSVSALSLCYFLFLVDSIDVDGCACLTAGDVIALSGLKQNKHILLNRVGEAKERLLKDSHIKAVSIRRIYPDRIHITITERKRVAEIVSAGGMIVIDENGYVLDINPAYDTTDLLIVYGMGTVGYQVDQTIADGGELRAGTLVSILNELSVYSLIKEMRVLDVSNALSIKLETKGGLTIMVGQPTDIDEKFSTLPAVLDNLVEQNLADGGVLYLLSTGKHVYSPVGETTPTENPTDNTAGDPGTPDKPDTPGA